MTSADIQKFINALPRDRVSDRAIRTVEVTGDYRVGVYGVFRPEEFPGGANLHPVNTTEIYYMLEGVAHAGHGGYPHRLYPRAHRHQSTGLRNRGGCFPASNQGGRHHHPWPHAALVQ